MRRLALMPVVVLALTVTAASANGPSGSSESNNQVSCGAGTATAVAVVYAGTNGVEVCNDGTTLPLQGRVIATTDQGGYVAADGDAGNPAQAQGWIRIDATGVRCGDSAGGLDSTNPGANDTKEDCG